jgi:hypothetical protein
VTDAVLTAATAAVISTGLRLVPHADISEQWATIRVMSLSFLHKQKCYGCAVTVSPYAVVPGADISI